MDAKEIQGRINEQMDQQADPGGARIPEKVWIQWYGDDEFASKPYDATLDEPVTWCADKINEHDVCYVTEESAVLAQVKAYRIGFAAAGRAITKELKALSGPLAKAVNKT